MSKRSGSILELLDALLLLVSPLAIILFIFLIIAMADGLGQHVQRVRSLDQYGQVITGEWHPARGDSYYAAVWVANGKYEGLDIVKYDIHLINTRHYPARRLARLKEGQPVRVRYVEQPGVENAAAFEDDYPTWRGFPAYVVTQYIGPLLIAWVVIILHPEFLYLGLIDNQDPYSALLAKS